jgi:hypothetical protein
MVFGWINSGLKYVERSEKPDSDQIYSNMQHDIEQVFLLGFTLLFINVSLKL